jgi:uncharacterized protein YacL
MFGTIGLIVALILAVVAQIEARGRSLLAWAAIIGFAVLLYGRLT